MPPRPLPVNRSPLLKPWHQRAGPQVPVLSAPNSPAFYLPIQNFGPWGRTAHAMKNHTTIQQHQLQPIHAIYGTTGEHFNGSSRLAHTKKSDHGNREQKKLAQIKFQAQMQMKPREHQNMDDQIRTFLLDIYSSSQNSRARRRSPLFFFLSVVPCSISFQCFFSLHLPPTCHRPCRPACHTRQPLNT